MNREQRRRVARDRRLKPEDREALSRPGARPMPLGDPRLVAAMRAINEDMARRAEAGNGPSYPSELAEISSDDGDLVTLVRFALEDLQGRLTDPETGEGPDLNEVPDAVLLTHVLAWGIKVGRQLEKPEIGLRAVGLRARGRGG